MQRVEIFTDGACKGNPGPGGWAALLRLGKHEKELTGSDPESFDDAIGRFDEFDEEERSARTDLDLVVLLGEAGLLERAGSLIESLEGTDTAAQYGRWLEAAYLDAEDRIPGLEGIARHAAFLVRTGRKDEARSALAEIDKRMSRANPHFRKEARAWRDFAASAIG